MSADQMVSLGSAATSLWLPTFLDLAIKSLVVLAGAALLTSLIRRASAATRHLIWCVSVASLLLLPALSVALPQWGVLPQWLDRSDSVVDLRPEPMRLASPRRALSPGTSAGSIRRDIDEEDAVERTLPGSTVPMSAKALMPASFDDAPAQGHFLLRITNEPSLWLFLGWLLGMGFVLALTFLGLLRLRLLSLNSQPITDGPLEELVRESARRLGVTRRVRLLQSGHPAMPMTWGLFSPRLLVPKGIENWSAERRRVVVVHELAHVKRWDFLTQLFTQAACIVYWFNPLIWFASRRMKIEREAACDDLVLGTGFKASDYAEHLLSIASSHTYRQLLSPSAIPMARHSELERRLRVVLDAGRNRRVMTRTTLAVGLTVGCCFSVPLAMVGTFARGDEKPNTFAAPAEVHPTGNRADEHEDRDVVSDVPEARVRDQVAVTVKVVDEEGRPIEDAVLTPNGLHVDRGWAAWRAELHGDPTPVKTNSEGLGTLVCPKYAQEKAEARAVDLRVEHVDYPGIRREGPITDQHIVRMVLTRGSTIKVVGYRESEDRPLDLLYPMMDCDYAANPQWREVGDGVRMTRQVPTGPRSMRLIAFPDEGPTLFSDVVDFEAEKDRIHEFKLPLKPGVRVEGQLDPSVPRPVQNGRVFAVVQQIELKDRDLAWYDWEPVDEDGRFVFESLPTAPKVLLTATCDGFVSKNPPDRPAATFRQSSPQPFTVDGRTVSLTIEMEPAASSQVLVVDNEGMPIEAAVVAFSPNVWTGRGNTIFSIPYRTSDRLLSGKAAIASRSDEWDKLIESTGFLAVSDQRGIATVRNLPGYSQVVEVLHHEYELPIREVGPEGSKRTGRYAFVELAPSKTAKTVVTLQKKGSEFVTNREKKREIIYDPSNDAKDDLAAALANAKKHGKRVVVMWGGNWCPWCYKLHDVLTKDAEISAILRADYELVMIDALNYAEMLASYSEDADQYGYPFLTILDADGQVLTNQAADGLGSGKGYDVQKVKDFFVRWAEP